MPKKCDTPPPEEVTSSYNFDKLTVTQLKKILLFHNIDYSEAKLKKDLVNLCKSIKPKKKDVSKLKVVKGSVVDKLSHSPDRKSKKLDEKRKEEDLFKKVDDMKKFKDFNSKEELEKSKNMAVNAKSPSEENRKSGDPKKISKEDVRNIKPSKASSSKKSSITEEIDEPIQSKTSQNNKNKASIDLSAQKSPIKSQQVSSKKSLSKSQTKSKKAESSLKSQDKPLDEDLPEQSTDSIAQYHRVKENLKQFLDNPQLSPPKIPKVSKQRVEQIPEQTSSSQTSSPIFSPVQPPRGRSLRYVYIFLLLSSLSVFLFLKIGLPYCPEAKSFSDVKIEDLPNPKPIEIEQNEIPKGNFLKSNFFTSLRDFLCIQKFPADFEAKNPKYFYKKSTFFPNESLDIENLIKYLKARAFIAQYVPLSSLEYISMDKKTSQNLEELKLRTRKIKKGQPGRIKFISPNNSEKTQLFVVQSQTTRFSLYVIEILFEEVPVTCFTVLIGLLSLPFLFF